MFISSFSRFLQLSFVSICFLLQPNTDPQYSQPTVGKVLLQARGFYTEDYWFWICASALLGFSILYNVLFIIALTYLNRESYSISSTFIDFLNRIDLLKPDQIYSFERFKEYDIR